MMHVMYDKKGPAVAKRFAARGFEAVYCPTKDEALDTIEKAILLFREQGKTGERFSQTIARLGFEYVEKELLEGDIMSRKQQILDAELHVTGGATC